MSLVYLTAHGMSIDSDGQLGLPTKTYSALLEYASRWDGPVIATSLESPVAMERTSPGVTWQTETDESVRYVRQVKGPSGIAQLGAKLVQIQVSAPGRARAMDLGVPVILTDDNSPRVRRDIMKVHASGQAGRIRIEVGQRRRQLAVDRDVRKADGFQCNGFAAHEYYSRVRKDALRFFDHRITGVDVETSQRCQRDRSGRFTLGFSGRLMEIKGVQHLPALMEDLRANGDSPQLEVFGDGPLRKTLEHELGRSAFLHGFVEFDPDWKEKVRASVDLMVLPHVQGDSSSTYYESLGMGIPVVGFANDTLTPLAKETGAAWTAPMGDVDALAALIRRLQSEPDLVRTAAERGLAFMAEHSMEREFDQRLEHMKSLV